METVSKTVFICFDIFISVNPAINKIPKLGIKVEPKNSKLRTSIKVFRDSQLSSKKYPKE